MKRFLVVVPIFLSIILGACAATPEGQMDPKVGTSVAQTQTASMWTATPVTPSPTPVPKEAVIVNALNVELRQEADPLEDAMDAKFSIMDIGFEPGGNPPATTIMSIHVKCEWVTSSSCTAERAFVVLAHVFEKDGVRKKVIEQIPTTIKVIRVRAFNHMEPIGIVEIPLDDLLRFADGKITGDQLAARAIRFLSHP